jgi:hypothetical protein
MRNDGDLVVLYAIGETLDRFGATESLRSWLDDADPRLRQGGCLASGAVSWRRDLEGDLLARCRDRDWDVREAAWPALERLRLQRDAESLVEAIQQEREPATRWALLDAVLELGYQGVVEISHPEWARRLWQADLPHPLRQRARARLRERSKELVKELSDRKRP